MEPQAIVNSICGQYAYRKSPIEYLRFRVLYLGFEPSSPDALVQAAYRLYLKTFGLRA
jgi:hypothetical protein